MDIISEVEKIVENQCKQESNIYGYGAWENHIKIVYEYSLKLAKKAGADKEIVAFSALFHDYASVLDKSLYEDHHIHSGALAEKILNQFGYDKNKIEIIKDCIFRHRGSIHIDKITIEAKCLANADAIAHIDQVPSLLYLAYVSRGMGIDKGAKWVSDKITRSWDKLTPEAKDIIRDKYLSAKKILDGNI